MIRKTNRYFKMRIERLPHNNDVGEKLRQELIGKCKKSKLDDFGEDCIGTSYSALSEQDAYRLLE